VRQFYNFIILVYLALPFLIMSGVDGLVQSDGWESFGERISPEGAVPVTEVIDLLELAVNKEFKISGELITICQQKGCWTTLETEDDREVRMTFKDYGFFLPVDYSGKSVVAEGTGFIKVTDIETLRHLAKDAGKTDEEIDLIKEPRTEYLFDAKGVLIR
jgi:hypothetical protein